jgi:hypothetical protein
MDFAGRLLADADPPIELPRPVRSSGAEPREPGGDAAALAEVVAGEPATGRLAVIVPSGRRAEVAAALPRLGPGATGGGAGCGGGTR